MSMFVIEMGSRVIVRLTGEKGIVVNLRPDVNHYLVLLDGGVSAKPYRMEELINTGKVIR